MRRILAALLIACAGCRPSRPILGTAEAGALTVGVALPLSGKLRAFGEGGRGAAELAAKNNPRIQIAVRDSKGDAEGAAAAVEDLVLSDGAIAIVGPLFRAEASAAAEKAQDLGVPLIALTSDRDVTSEGAYVFSAGVSPEDEMDALVAHAIDEQKLTTFAVLHPRIEYGEKMLGLFQERVEARGGTIVRIESYDAEETTFTEPIRRLVQRDDLSVRPEYKAALAKCKDARDNFRKARCERDARDQVPPLIEFQALFIPDGYERIALIAHAVVAEDVVVERDPRMIQQIEKTLGYRVQPVTLLGTSAWNSPELPRKAGRTVENSLFPDVTFDGAKDDATRTFLARFTKAFERRPERQDALLYDATCFYRDLLTEERPRDTDELRAAMHRFGGIQGVTGEISFQDGSAARRKFHILTIKNQVIREAGG